MSPYNVFKCCRPTGPQILDYHSFEVYSCHRVFCLQTVQFYVSEDFGWGLSHKNGVINMVSYRRANDYRALLTRTLAFGAHTYWNMDFLAINVLSFKYHNTT